MGLAGTLTSWQLQTLYFGHEHGDRYSVLVMDNRGVGRSDRPVQRYTTTQMAGDAFAVCDAVGWTGERALHVVGISLGGMIAQEMACAVPSRLASLTLLCTTAKLQGEKSFLAGLGDRLAMLQPKSEGDAIVDVAQRIFVPEFLASADDFDLPGPDTPDCGPAKTPDGKYPRFESTFQRFQAQEIVKRRGLTSGRGVSRAGFMGQMAAAGGHWKSAGQLKRMADAVGRDRIMVIHGTRDRMIAVRNGHTLIKAIEPGVGMIVDGLGHAPIFERTKWFNELLDKRIGIWAKL